MVSFSAVEIGKHTPALTMVQADITSIAEYLHSVQATMGGPGQPSRKESDVRLAAEYAGRRPAGGQGLL